MKKLIIILVLFPLFIQAQFIKEDWTQASIWLDPTVTDNGAQIGAEITQVMHWGYASVGASKYISQKQRVGYSDLVGTIGINGLVFKELRWYGGLRLGRVWRKDPKNNMSGHELAGGIVGIDYRLSKKIMVGVSLWTDYREDQKNTRFGDSDGYQKGLITNNPLLQENGAFKVTIIL